MRINNELLFIFLGLLQFAQNELAAQIEHSLHFVESRYQYIEPKSTIDSLVLNVQWDFRSTKLSKSDSVFFCDELIKLCSLGYKKVRLVYWEFEKVEYSQWIFKKRSYELLELIKKINCFEEVVMITKFEVIQRERYDQFPYDKPQRTVLFLLDN